MPGLAPKFALKLIFWRTLALEESKETSIRGFRLQTPRCNLTRRYSGRNMKARSCVFEYRREIKYDSYTERLVQSLLRFTYSYNTHLFFFFLRH